MKCKLKSIKVLGNGDLFLISTSCWIVGIDPLMGPKEFYQLLKFEKNKSRIGTQKENQRSAEICSSRRTIYLSYSAATGFPDVGPITNLFGRENNSCLEEQRKAEEADPANLCWKVQNRPRKLPMLRVSIGSFKKCDPGYKFFCSPEKVNTTGPPANTSVKRPEER